MEPIKKFSFRKQVTNVFVFSILIIIFSSCEEDPLKAGFNLLGNDTLEVKVDTLPVELYTVTSGPYRAISAGTSPLGSLYDQIFGQFKAELMTDINYPGGNIVNLEYNSVSDSLSIYDVTLHLVYSSYYGDISNLDFNVYEMTGDIPDTTSDYEVGQELYDPIPINIGQPVRVSDTTNIDTIKVGDQVTDINYTIVQSLSVKLSSDYGQKFIDPSMFTDSVYYPKFNDGFKKAIKGLYFKTNFRNSLGGGFISLDHLNSTLVVTTIESANGVNDTIENSFFIGYHDYTDYKHVNMFKNIPGPEINKVLNDTLKINPEAYIQALAGTQVLARIPGLKQKRTEYGYHMVIQKAELIFPINKSYLNDLYKPPYLLGIFVRDSLANKRVYDDGLLSKYLNGLYDSIRFQYTLNIGNQVHAYLRDRSGSSYGDSFYIFAADKVYIYSVSSTPLTTYSIQSPGRVVLNNADSPDRKPYLRLIYSKMPEK
jgi:hypothetical protein